MLWPNVARLAISFRKAGAAVDVVAPAGHPVHRMHAPNRTFEYRPTSAYGSIKAAIATSQPDLIVPCDDRVVAHLHRLYDEASAVPNEAEMCRTASLIEKSLGSPLSYRIVVRRSSLSTLAQLTDVHVPQTSAVDCYRNLLDWVRQHGLPAVLKLDRSCGGKDVIVIRRLSEVVSCLLRMRLQKSWVRRTKSFLVDGDAEPFLAPRNLSAAQICVQSYVTGRHANCAVACWHGDVLGSTAVEVLERRSDFGIASVVRRVKGEAMIAAARSIARHLDLSGIFGFDFVLDDGTQQAKLIEINPRATQIDHFAGYGGEPDLPSALLGAISGEPVVNPIEQQLMDEVALFPQEWQRDPASRWLLGTHDVPFEEPEFLRYFGYCANERVRQPLFRTESKRLS
jgi:biotin carboxylase